MNESMNDGVDDVVNDAIDESEIESSNSSLNNLPTIESGKIWENRSTKEVLLAIFKSKKAEYAIARMASEDGVVDGEFLITKSTNVQGARLLNDEMIGYPALFAMLKIQHGSYSLLDCSNSPADAAHLEEGLKIRVNQLVNALPDLPATMEELVSGGAGMTRMRSYEGSDLPSEADIAEEKLARKSAKADKTDQVATTDARPQTGISPVLIATIVMVLVLAVAGAFMFMHH